MKTFYALVLGICLVKVVWGLKVATWTKNIGKTYNPPYLAEYGAEVGLCLDLCLQVSYVAILSYRIIAVFFRYLEIPLRQYVVLASLSNFLCLCLSP